MAFDSAKAVVAVLACFLATVVDSKFYTYPPHCPDIQPVTISPEEYSGPWYDTSHTMHSDIDTYDCSIIYINVSNTHEEEFPYGKTKGNTIYTDGKLVLNDVENVRILNTTRVNVTSYTEKEKRIINYYVLSTDNANYSIDYQCLEKDRTIKHFVRLITRKKDTAQQYKRLMEDVLRMNNIPAAMDGRDTAAGANNTLVMGGNNTACEAIPSSSAP